MSDVVRSPPRAVISDIVIASVHLSPSDFATNLAEMTPAAYSPFRGFIGGEYDYQSAIYKAEVSTETGTLAKLTSLSVSVDLPDVFDRGSVTTSATGSVTVTSNRSFYYVEDVSATLKSSTVLATPVVTSVTLVNSYCTFQVDLRDVNDNRVAGVVSWAIRGSGY